MQRVRSRYATAEHQAEQKVVERNSEAFTDTAARQPSGAVDALGHGRSQTQALLPAAAARRRGDLESIDTSQGEFMIKGPVMTPASSAAEHLQPTVATQLMQSRNSQPLQNGHSLPAGTRNCLKVTLGNV